VYLEENCGFEEEIMSRTNIPAHFPAKWRLLCLSSFKYWQNKNFSKKRGGISNMVCRGESFGEIAQKFQVAEATAEIYTIDMIPYRQGDSAMCNRLLKEMVVSEGQFIRVVECLTSPGVTLQEILDETDLRCHQIHAVVVALLHEFHF